MCNLFSRGSLHVSLSNPAEPTPYELEYYALVKKEIMQGELTKRKQGARYSTRLVVTEDSR